MQPASSPFNIPTPTPLPVPPLLEHLLLERPWPLVIPLIVIALIVSRVLSRSPRAPRIAWIGAVLLLIAGPAIYLLSAFITTDREHMKATTTSLVDAVAKADTAAVERLLDPGCYLHSRFAFPGYTTDSKGMDRGEILDQVPRTIRDNPIAEHGILESQALSRGPGIGSTQLKVRVVVELQGGGFKLPVQSWWKVDWRRGSDGQWRATAIEALTDPAGSFR